MVKGGKQLHGTPLHIYSNNYGLNRSKQEFAKLGSFIGINTL